MVSLSDFDFLFLFQLVMMEMKVKGTRKNSKILFLIYKFEGIVVFLLILVLDVIIGMAKSSTGLGPHGAPPKMGKILNNFWEMGWGVGEK